jgi:serine/threonine protein phosphatase 1
MSVINLETQIQGPIAVIGDVHGQVDKLSLVLNRLRLLPNFERRWIVFIGDLVDRGPAPRKAVEIVLDLWREHPRTTAIMGNHEFAMCSALGWLPAADVSLWSHRWVDYYDSERTFESYGADRGDLADLAAKVPDEHREFLSRLPWCVEHPHLLFVHAGLDPHLPFPLQLNILRQRDFSLTRPPWLCEKSFVADDPPIDCPVTLVSGHVKVDKVVMRERRLLVDTTGGEEGHLSCVLMPERLVVSSDATEIAPLHVGSERSPKSSITSSSWWKLWG